MSALADEIRDVVRAERERDRAELLKLIDDRLRRVLDERDADQVGGLAELAKWLGKPTADAARKMCERDEELRSLAIKSKKEGGHRSWRRSEVLALMATRRAGK